MVMQATSASSSTYGRSAAPFSETHGPKMTSDILLDQFVERVADRAEGAVGQALHGADDELDRTLEHTPFEILVDDELKRRQNVLVEAAVVVDVVEEQPDPGRGHIAHSGLPNWFRLARHPA